MANSKQQEFLDTLKDPMMMKMKETLRGIIDNPNTDVVNVDYIDLGADFLTMDVRLRIGTAKKPRDK